MHDPPTALLLDIGGVVLVDPMATIFDEIAGRSSQTRDEITAYYAAELREPFWTGRLAEPDFWNRLLGYAAVDGSSDSWRNRLLGIMRPLPAATELGRLAEQFRLAALSNHRAEWLRPALERYDLANVFEHVLISSETGLVKPDLVSYRNAVQVLGVPPEDAMLVDDKQANLDSTVELGFRTLLADPAGIWIHELLNTQ